MKLSLSLWQQDTLPPHSLPFISKTRRRHHNCWRLPLACRSMPDLIQLLPLPPAESFYAKPTISLLLWEKVISVGYALSSLPGSCRSGTCYLSLQDNFTAVEQNLAQVTAERWRCMRSKRFSANSNTRGVRETNRMQWENRFAGMRWSTIL